MAAYGLYTHIRANRIRSGFMFAGLFLLVYVMVFAAALIMEAMAENAPLGELLRRAWRDLLMAFPFATAIAGLWLLISYRFHQALIDAVTGGHSVTREEEPRLYNLLENLCISRGITMPKLKIVENGALNAFATGLNDKQYAISVTSALRDRLDDAEIEAVLAHELTHIRNGDVRMMVIAVVIAGIIAFVAELVFRGLFQSGIRWGSGGNRSNDSKSGGGAMLAILIALALIALSWLLSVVIRFALSRSREYLADAGAVELTKNPDAMIGALRKIQGRGEIEGAPSAVMEMCVDNPRSGFVDLFATHPAIEDRVVALVRTAGGRDPGPLELPAPEPAEDAAAAAAADAGTPQADPNAPGALLPGTGPWAHSRSPDAGSSNAG